MKPTEKKVSFVLENGEIATIEKAPLINHYGFTTDKGYSSWDMPIGYTSFERAFVALVRYEKEQINDLKYS